jgi:DNA primase
MPWVDYRHIKASVTIEQVLGHYGVELRVVGSQKLAGPCPLTSHGGDRSNRNAFHVDTERNIFNCFTHCGGGNVLDFVAKMEGCTVRDAAAKLSVWFLMEPGAAPEAIQQNGRVGESGPNAEPEGNRPLTFELKGLKGEHPLLRRVKELTPQTIKTFGVGLCTKGLLAGWIALPVHNKDGQIVAYVGRAVNDTQAEIDGKYKFPPRFRKSFEVYNLHRVLQDPETLTKHGLIVVEGFFGVMRLHQHGYSNVVALMGKELSDTQAELLRSVTNRLTLFLDGDEPGREAAKRVGERLAGGAFVRIVQYPDGPKRKPAHFTKEDLRALLQQGHP